MGGNRMNNEEVVKMIVDRLEILLENQRKILEELKATVVFDLEDESGEKHSDSIGDEGGESRRNNERGFDSPIMSRDHLSRKIEESTDSKPPSTKKTTMQTTLEGIKIVGETESKKAWIVKRINDGFTAIIAKSHLAEEYSKDDVRTSLRFKADRAWALTKLDWSDQYGS